MAEIFISYAREDFEQVRPIAMLIEGAGWSVFWDRTIPPGEDWRQYIGKALDDAKCVIAVWSKYSLESNFVQEEAEDGKERKILIPVLVEDVRPPLGFRSIQHEDLRYWKGDFDHPRAKSLIKAIKGYAGNPQNAATESSAKSKLVAARKAERPRVEPPVQTRAELGQRESQLNEFTPREAMPNNEKSAQKSPATNIGIWIALFVVIVVALAIIFRCESTISQTITNSIGMEFVLIPSGTFIMGSQTSPEETAEKFGRDVVSHKDEHPAHPVKISQPFYLQKTEVTQGQWRSVMGKNPSSFSECGDDCPVEKVSWDEVEVFLEKLNKLEGRDGADRYRLPTEAEWEYSCRAGTTTAFSFGDDAEQLAEYGWFGGNSDDKTHPVGTKKPNPWRLYDMHGNVLEWVEDDWHNNYKGAPDDGRGWIGDPRAAIRVLRGGSWDFGARACRSAARGSAPLDNRDAVLGFRLARSVALGP